MTTTQLLIGGQWTAARSGATEEIHSPFDGNVVGEVPTAGPADVELALTAAERGAATWRRTPAHERMRILLTAAQLADERTPQIAATLSAENGKTITEATSEVGRSGDLIRLSAFEGTQLYGDTLPLDANKGTGFDKIGFTVRQPVGVVVAITPFNFPSLLVLHKIAPALAAGNAVVRVLVIPRHLAAEIAEQGLAQEELEAYASTKIHAGEPLWGNYPPGDELKAEYQASRAAAAGPVSSTTLQR